MSQPLKVGLMGRFLGGRVFRPSPNCMSMGMGLRHSASSFAFAAAAVLSGPAAAHTPFESWFQSHCRPETQTYNCHPSCLSPCSVETKQIGCYIHLAADAIAHWMITTSKYKTIRGLVRWAAQHAITYAQHNSSITTLRICYTKHLL